MTDVDSGAVTFSSTGACTAAATVAPHRSHSSPSLNFGNVDAFSSFCLSSSTCNDLTCPSSSLRCALHIFFARTYSSWSAAKRSGRDLSSPMLLEREVLRKAGVRGVVEPEGGPGSSKRERATVEVLDMKEGALGDMREAGGEVSGIEEERVVIGLAETEEARGVEEEGERTGVSLTGEAARKFVGRPAEKAIEMGRRESAGALILRTRWLWSVGGAGTKETRPEGPDGDSTTLRPPARPRELGGVTLLRMGMLALVEMEGRNEDESSLTIERNDSGRGADGSSGRSLLSPPPIMRFKKPLFFGLRVLTGG